MAYTSPFGNKYEVGPEGRASNRTVRLQVLVSFEEQVQVRDLAARAELTVSTWMRKLALREIARMDVKQAELAEAKRAVGIVDQDTEPVTPRRVPKPPPPVTFTRKEIDGNVADIVIDMDQEARPAAPALDSLFGAFEDGVDEDEDGE